MTSNPIEVIVVRGTRPNSPPYQVATFFPTFYETTYAFDRVDDSIGEVCENQRLYALINGTTFNSLEAQDPGVATALQNFINAVDQIGANYTVTIENVTINIREAFRGLGSVAVTTERVYVGSQEARGQSIHNPPLSRIKLNFDFIRQQDGSDPASYLPSLYDTFLHEVLHLYSSQHGMGWPGHAYHTEWNLNDAIDALINEMAALGIDLLANDTPNDHPCS